MENITNLNDLFIEQLREVCNAERQQLQAFPDLVNRASSSELRDSFKSHLESTRAQRERLDKLLDDLDILVSGEFNQTMKGLLLELDDLLDRSSDPDVRDAALVVALQQIEHFEIAAYGTLCALAQALGRNDVAVVLHHSLEEEKKFDVALTRLANDSINRKAVTALIS
jgi:ferritin-like metal-binding protein YciE